MLNLLCVRSSKVLLEKSVFLCLGPSFLKLLPLFLFVFIVRVCVWRSEYSFQESVGSVHGFQGWNSPLQAQRQAFLPHGSSHRPNSSESICASRLFLSPPCPAPQPPPMHLPFEKVSHGSQVSQCIAKDELQLWVENSWNFLSCWVPVSWVCATMNTGLQLGWMNDHRASCTWQVLYLWGTSIWHIPRKPSFLCQPLINFREGKYVDVFHCGWLEKELATRGPYITTQRTFLLQCGWTNRGFGTNCVKL